MSSLASSEEQATTVESARERPRKRKVFMASV
jgi:hypothetical protein